MIALIATTHQFLILWGNVVPFHVVTPFHRRASIIGETKWYSLEGNNTQNYENENDNKNDYENKRNADEKEGDDNNKKKKVNAQ